VAYEFADLPFTSEKVVLKAINTKNHDFDENILENSRMEALILERLSSSPRIVDQYGACGTSTFLEYMPGEIKEPMLWQGWGYASEEELQECEKEQQQKQSQGSTDKDNAGNAANDGDLDSNLDLCRTNEWTPTKKLQMALEMAEALAYVHGFEGGVMVHDDIKIGQYLMNEQGQLKLNDFNRGEIMFYDDHYHSPHHNNNNGHGGEYCKYRNGGVYGIHRAPEENAEGMLNEQIDVYSLGNIYYSLLTGLWNFYSYEDDEVVQQKVIFGDVPYLDDRYRTRSFAEKALVEAIEYTLVHNVHHRPSIFQVVDFMTRAMAQNDAHEKRRQRRSIG
jgi:serine/threonine protein kinase